VAREGGSHTIVYVGSKRSAVPRHREIRSHLALRILGQLDLREDR
jgi:hypothetical protein